MALPQLDAAAGLYTIVYEDGDEEAGVLPALVRMAAKAKPHKLPSEPSEAKERSFDVPPELKGVFSAELLESYQQVFALYDGDDSGAVDKEELTQMLERLGERPTPARLRELLKEADADGDDEVRQKLRRRGSALRAPHSCIASAFLSQVDFQEFLFLMAKQKDGAFAKMVDQVDKTINPTGVFREYAIPAVERLAAAVGELQAFASSKQTSLDPRAFDPLDEMLRLVPVTWQRSERLVSLGQVYRAPSDAAPKRLKQRTMALTERAIALSKEKQTKDQPSSPHCKALGEALAAVRWLSIDFRITAEEARNGVESIAEPVSDR